MKRTAGALSEAAREAAVAATSTWGKLIDGIHGMRELLASLGRQCPHDGNVWQKILRQSVTVL